MIIIIIVKKNYYKNKKFFKQKKKRNLSKHIIMVNFTTHELRLITRKRGIKNY